MLAGDSHAEVRAIVDSGFEKLKEWLEIRLQRQEDLMLNGAMRETPGRPISASTRTPIKDSLQAESHSATASERIDDKRSLGQSCCRSSLDEDPLRVAAIGAVDCHGLTSESVPDVPGSVHDENTSFIQAETHISAWERSPAFDASVGLETAADDTGMDVDEHRVRVRIHEKNPDNVHVRAAQEQNWQSQLMNVFDELDLDGSGSLDRYEFTEAFKEVGLPPLEAFEIFNRMDDSSNGVIDRIEWLHVVEEASRGSDEEVSLVVQFIERVASRTKDKGRFYDIDRRTKLWLILRHDAPPRMMWDLLMMLLLFYISVTMPYTLGFGELSEDVDRVLDMLFCCDVMLNFRTTYADRDDSVIVDGKKIAAKYLKSWFLLDFMSSVPFDMITAGLLPSLTPARFLKIGKIAKVLKLLRISKMLKVFEGSELGDKLEEKSTTKAHQTVARFLKLTAFCFMISHWLACFGAAIDTTNLESYFVGKEDNPSEGQMYLAALYWAMTTLSTVGFGDVIPVTDSDRAYAMFAMIVGGAFYGYIVGSITSIVADGDRNARAFYERMDLLQCWLDSHREMPKILRRRIRKHFKVTLSEKSVMDDSSIVSDLSPELRADTAFFIIHENVRMNPMFNDIPNSAMANLVDVLQKNYTNKNEYIVKAGDPGIAMYCLVAGVARYDKGVPWSAPGTEPMAQRFQQLIEGDSFGEEIVFGLEESYLYTVVAVTDCHFHSISEDGFQDKYRNMPELRQQMYSNYMRSINASISVLDGVDAQEVSACSPQQDSLSLQLDKPQPAAGQLVGAAKNKKRQPAAGAESGSSGLKQKPFRKR